MVGIVNKPDINYGIWASNGDVAVPSSEKVEIGHIVEKPKKEIVNWIENRQDQFMAYLNQVGVAEWDSKTTYKANISFVNRSGTVYKAKSQNIDKDPTLNQDIWNISWATYSDFYNLSNRVVKIENEEGYLDLYVSKANPVMYGEATAPAYLLSNSTEFEIGMSLDSENNPTVTKKDNTSVRFKTITDLSSPTNDVVTMEVLLQFIQTYKVGDLYLTTNSGNPSTLLGYGIWQRYGEGRAIVGVSSRESDPDWTKGVSSIYGEYTHTQTLEELVEHSHEVGEGSIMPIGSFDRLYASGDDKTSVADSYSETKTAGEGKPFNIVQPSVTVFIWMRTS